MRLVEALEVEGLEILDARLAAQRVETVADFAEERATGGFESALKQLILLVANGGQLDFAFAFELSRGESWVEQNVGQQVEPESEIAAQYFGIDAKAVVAAVAVNR